MSNSFPENFSLSLVQQDVFYDQLHNMRSPKYNIGGYVNLGRINEEKLKQAHTMVLLNNRMFSMRLSNKLSGVFFSLSQTIDTELPIIDFSDENGPKEQALKWIDKAFSQPFDLYGGSLFHAFLLKISDEQYFYVGIAHHLMIDGWGFANWARQLGNYYSNEAPEIESENDFISYCTQDFSYLESERYRKDQSFWKDYLSYQPTRMFSSLRSLATNENNKCSQRLCFDISPELYERVLSSEETLKKNEHSLFLALVALYFSRIAQKSNIVVGVPAHNRRGALQKKFIGLYTSVSPVQIEVQNEWSFLRLVEEVKTAQAKVFRHQKYPVGHMVRDLGPAARAGLFEVGVNYLKLDNKFTYGDLSAEIRYFENDYQTVPFNLTVWENSKDEPVQLQIDFSLQYFEEDDIRMIGARFMHVLQQISNNSDVLIGDLDLLSPIEKPVVFPNSPSSFAEVNVEAPFIYSFEKQVLIQPDRVALSYQQQTFSYHLLNQLAGQLAVQLHSSGIGSGHLVGLLIGRKPEMIIAILALYKLGAAYLPLDPSYPISRLHFMLEDSECKLLLTSSDLLSLSEGLALETLTLDNCAQLTDVLDQSLSKPTRARPQELAYVIYTSGSTGKPKGVMVSQLALSNFLQSMAIQPGFTSNDWLLAITPFSFDISILELLLPLMSGGTVRLFHTALVQDVVSFKNDLSKYPITVVQMTPSAWKILLGAGWEGASNLTALTGGEALPSYLAETLKPKVKQLWNMYGPTETTIWSSCIQVYPPLKHNSIGRPIANTRMLVLDNHNRILPVGVFGMLHIGGDGLAEGYLFREELTNERFIHLFGARWYQTGDVARLLSNGEFEFQGRADHQVKMNGYRIELGEIEAILSRHPGVINSAVLIKTLASGREVLCAYYHCAPGVTEAALKDALAAALPSFMLPSIYMQVPVFPQTPGGKTDLKALPEPEFISSNNHEQNSLIYDGLTLNLLTLIKQHLQIKHLQPADNFFDVGASSMDVMEMSGKISRELSLTISVIDMFTHSSVQALVKYIEGSNSIEQADRRSRHQDAVQVGKARLNNRLNARKLLDEA